MKRSLTLAVLFAITGGAALAEINVDSLVADYQAQGFTRIEVRNGLTQTKVEAIRGTEKLEVVLDRATGSVLKSETGTVDPFENTSPGVSIRDRNRDFVRSASAGDDSSGTDSADDESADDDSQDHASGSDDGAGHDAGDDHGGDDGHDSSGSDSSDHESSDHDSEGHDGGNSGGGDSSGSGSNDD